LQQVIVLITFVDSKLNNFTLKQVFLFVMASKIDKKTVLAIDHNY